MVCHRRAWCAVTPIELVVERLARTPVASVGQRSGRLHIGVATELRLHPARRKQSCTPSIDERLGHLLPGLAADFGIKWRTILHTDVSVAVGVMRRQSVCLVCLLACPLACPLACLWFVCLSVFQSVVRLSVCSWVSGSCRAAELACHGGCWVRQLRATFTMRLSLPLVISEEMGND